LSGNVASVQKYLPAWYLWSTALAKEFLEKRGAPAEQGAGKEEV
jgi:hypothetical protein